MKKSKFSLPLTVKKIRHFLHPMRVFLNEVVLKIAEICFAPLPLQDKVIFSNFFGRGLSDDVKYILLNLLKREDKPALCWVVADKRVEVPEGVVPVKYRSIRYVYHLCTSKIWVFNIRNLYKTKKKTGQYYIQTYHGGMLGLKKAEAAAMDLDEDYVRDAKADSKIVDLFYTNNKIIEKVYREDFFDYKGEILITDIPRMSVLLNPPEGIKDKVYSFFKIPKDVHIALYAPTFRKDCNLDIYKWNYEKVLNALRRRFSEKFVLLLRLHPNLMIYADEIQYSDVVINASSYPDMQELLVAADVMINDYSSSVFEYAYLKKPVFLYAPDLDSFVHGDRPLLFDIKEIPFKFCKSENDFILEIENFDKTVYTRRLDEFFERHGLHDTGKGDECIANRIIEKIAET